MLLVNLLIKILSLCLKCLKQRVTRLLKAGDRNDFDNYRPISILPILSKLLERHVHNHLYQYLADNNLLYAWQSGFHRYHRTDTALIKIVDDLLFSADQNRVSGLVLVDYRKAFDMVDHYILMQKLEIYGMCERSRQWFDSYLANRKQFVSIGRETSELGDIPHGVPQGSIFGPLLFVMFINDLPIHVQLDSAGVDLYADDTTLSCSADVSDRDQLESTLEVAVNEVER